MLKAIDIVAAISFVACEAFVLTLELTGRLNNAPKLLNTLVMIAEILAVVSIIYLATLRIFPYAWLYMRGTR